MRPILPILADGDVVWILFIMAVLLGLVLLAGWGVMAYRKHLTHDEFAPGESPDGFTLSELRSLKKNGQISEEEYEKAKAMVLAMTQRRASAPLDSKKPPSAG
jgi:putative oligomerization/nucleic acid binding protein